MLVANLAALALLGHPVVASYRDQYPMPDLTVPSGWGVNVRLVDMDDSDIEAISDMGAKWIRIDLLWARVEQKAGVYDFSKYDPVIDGATRNGMRAILILDYGNKVHDVDAPRTREGRAAFTDFATAAVRHYKHRGVIWEIWNEPNLSHFWRGAPSADEYAALVRVVVPAMRDVSADEWIMGGAFSRFDWPFIEQAFSYGMLNGLDAVSVHPYRDKKAPETVGADWAQLRTMISKYAPNKKLTMISSEWGGSTYSGGWSERVQGQMAMRQYLANLSAGVPLTIWYSWRDRPDASSDKEQHFGLVDRDMHGKSSRDSVANTVGALSGYSFEDRIALGDGNFGLIFKKGTSRKLAAWSSNQGSNQVRLPATAAWFATSSNRQLNLSNDIQVLSQK